MKPAAWPAVALAGVALICVTILAALHIDTTAIGVIAVPIIGGLIYGEARSISNQTNGTQTRLLELLARQNEHLAAMHPAGPTPDTPPLEESP